MIALGVPYHNVYYETFDMYNNNFQVFGHGNPYDERTIIGDLNSLDFMIFYTEKGTVNKVVASGNRVKDFSTLREAMKQGVLPRVGEYQDPQVFEKLRTKLRVFFSLI